MRFRYVLLILVLAAFDDGRDGDRHYKAGRYTEAAAAYQAAIERSTDAAELAALYHNLGAALHRAGELEAALTAFESAYALAGDDADLRARAAFNAGNTAYRMQDLQRAVDYYRASLVQAPAEDAQFNYEFARRELEEQEQNPQGGDQQGDDEQQSQQPGGDQQGDTDPQQDGGGDQEQQQDQPSPERQQQPEPGQDLSQQQAEQILQALQNDEEQLLRRLRRTQARPRRSAKDW